MGSLAASDCKIRRVRSDSPWREQKMKRAVRCSESAQLARKAICPMRLMRRRSIVGKLAPALAISLWEFLTPRDQAFQSSRVSSPGPQAIQSSTQKRRSWLDFTVPGGVRSSKSKRDRMFPPPKIPPRLYFVARQDGRWEIKD